MNRPIKNLNSGFPVFDGNEAQAWLMQMTAPVTNATVRNVMPGVFYTFVFRQNAVGGHIFKWPANCLNAPPVCTDPHSYTTVNFIGTQVVGQLITNIPGTWTPQ